MHAFIPSKDGFCAACSSAEQASIHHVMQPPRKRGAAEAIELAQEARRLHGGFLTTSNLAVEALGKAIEALAREVMENARGEV
jgi:hypothetical protein